MSDIFNIIVGHFHVNCTTVINITVNFFNFEYDIEPSRRI